MALARLFLKNLQQRVVYSSSYSSSLLSKNFTDQTLSNIQKQRKGPEFLMWLSTEVGSEGKSEAKKVAVSEGKKKSSLFPKRKRRWSLWRHNNNQDFQPALLEFFPSGLGNALMQATENINMLFENLSPSQLLGRVKEQKECYKLKFDVPGLSKEDVKIRVEDGILTIQGERKEEEEEEESDGESWSSSRYGYYNTSLALPNDAKVDEIKAEMKDGVLHVIIPRTEKPDKDVKEIQIN